MFEKIKPKIEAKEIFEAKKTEPKEEKIIEPGKKGFFAAIREKIITTKIDEAQFEKLFWEMEMALMESNVAVEVIGKIKNDLKSELVEKPIRRTKVEDTVMLALKSSIEGLFENDGINLLDEIKSKQEKPYVIAFFGINGSGKTTSIAKLASMLKSNKISCVLAASDTFRAASIEQLQQHADKLEIKLIKHDYGSDPAAVAFDAVKHAKAKNIDAVLVDTAGRMHSNENLIAEMKKIIRVAKPDLKIFVGESITGNDCVEQAKTFNDAVGIDGIILAKADIDEKGGAAVSVSYVTKKPILFLGTGQAYSDLETFDKEKIMKNIGLA
ncbi:signal recognition particle-docking protein FtsY [Candidatus Woesearchaeota archaeon]|nr:signal recognition particle-docking protein FtsY [Candidatus Woesearchaeota archaeon]